MDATNAARSAAQRVFDTVELLEMILLNLPVKDILLAHRTNKAFRNSTASSLKLRAKLFLQQNSATIRVETLPGRCMMARKPNNGPIELVDRGTALEFNPLLFHLSAPKKICGPRVSNPITCSTVLAPNRTPAQFLIGARKPASEYIKKMFITKPPVTSVGFEWVGPEGTSIAPVRSIRNEAGVTFEDILKVLRRWPRSDISFRLLVHSETRPGSTGSADDQYVCGFFVTEEEKQKLDGYGAPVVWDEMNSHYFEHGFEWNEAMNAWEDEDGGIAVGPWKVGDLAFFETYIGR